MAIAHKTSAAPENALAANIILFFIGSRQIQESLNSSAVQRIAKEAIVTREN